MLAEHLETFTFVDTETTGLDLDTHEVWEIAVGRMWRRQPDRGFSGCVESWQIKDVPLDTADAAALEIGNFMIRYDAERAVSHSFTVDKFDEYCDVVTHDGEDEVHTKSQVVACNVGFDVGFLSKVWDRATANRTYPWSFRHVEFESVMAGWITAAGAFMMPSGEQAHVMDVRWRSRSMYEAISVLAGVELPGAFLHHTAWGDVAMMMWATAVMLGDPAPRISISN